MASSDTEDAPMKFKKACSPSATTNVPVDESQTTWFDGEMARIEKEKDSMTIKQKLDQANVFKTLGNESVKCSDYLKAVDSYHRGILYCRDIALDPEKYGIVEHSVEDSQAARCICEAIYTNLALVHIKRAAAAVADDAEKPKLLAEAVRSASKALEYNSGNVKAIYRRGLARAQIASSNGCDVRTAVEICAHAKDDFASAIQLDPNNREARAELKAVQEHMKTLKRSITKEENKGFDFSNTLSALGGDDDSLCPDKSVRKELVKKGDGVVWYNADWLEPGALRCVVQVTFQLLFGIESEGKQISSNSDAVTLSFVLGDKDMHEGFTLAVSSMSVGEVAKFTFAKSKLQAKSALTELLSASSCDRSVWHLTFIGHSIWQDLDGDAGRLLKIDSEGYGESVEPLSEVQAHHGMYSADGNLILSSRSVADDGSDDPDAPSYVLDEITWEPLHTLCQKLRRGGRGQLRLRSVPSVPGIEETFFHCTIEVDLLSIVKPMQGPSDERWSGLASLVQERKRGEKLMVQLRKEAAAEVRFRRCAEWSKMMLDLTPELSAAEDELVAARGGIAWILLRRAGPILDMGTVRSDVLAVARKELAEAEDHCLWWRKARPNDAAARFLHAKIVLAQDDDFARARELLTEALKLDPSNPKISRELQRVEDELRKTG
eukprot:TRINITY_DN17127_c0_g1_i1.p1 TRINITY_DN17127_c0_g1~~TRINITY_DN17127_c0_g1_i1.p1  ORF type:complete len:663 (-),score=110.31 TRINITY_DN17127_c0_g1_i1:178-2166(-)